MEKEEEIRGVHPNYMGFLWKVISQIWEQDAHGNYTGGLALATKLIPYLPSGLQEKFFKKSENIRKAMMILQKSIKGSDLFTTAIRRNRVMQQASRELLRQFMRELCLELDFRGAYMEEKKRKVPIGKE